MKQRSINWLIIAVGLLVAGLLSRQSPLVLVASLFVLVEVMIRVWGTYGLERVEHDIKLSASRVFCGEEVQLQVEVANRKILPLPWIEVRDEIPEDVKMLTGNSTATSDRGRMEITHFFPLMWYEKVTRRYRLGCDKRGYFTFGPTRVMTGDLFGLAEAEGSFYQRQTLVVYPKIVPLDELGIPSAHLLGDIRARHSIHRDPILTLGVRDYQSGDSLKHIHWKSSARSGQLHTKVYEPTTSTDIGILLDVRTTVPPFFGTIPRLTELAIVTAASLCYFATEQGFRVGLYINEWRFRQGEAVRIPPSLNSGQLPVMLENLAKINPQPDECMPAGTLVAREGARMPVGSTLVAISAAPTPGLVSALHRVAREGREVALLVVGGEAIPGGQDGLLVLRVPDQPWDAMTTLQLRAR